MKPISALVEHALEHAAGVGGANLTVGGEHITEHAGGVVFLAAPGQDLEGGGVRLQQHVGFVDAGETLNRGAVKAQPHRRRFLLQPVRAPRI